MDKSGGYIFENFRYVTFSKMSVTLFSSQLRDTDKSMDDPPRWTKVVVTFSKISVTLFSNHLAHFRRRSLARARRGASGHFWSGTNDRRPTDDRWTNDRRPMDDRPTTDRRPTDDRPRWTKVVVTFSKISVTLHFRKCPLHFFPAS